MKCIKCDTDNKLKERQGNGGLCKNCNHSFAFDPKTMAGVTFTDKFFSQTLDCSFSSANAVCHSFCDQ